MPKVLLVEDNEMNRDMLSRRLLKRGFELLIAVDGAQAIDIATTQPLDLIMMDLSLPDMDGLEATSRIRSNPSFCGAPVIALTAHATAADRDRAINGGCDEYETKPVDLPRLLAKVNKLLNLPQE